MTDPTPKPPFIPDLYHLLNVFFIIPIKTKLALEFAGLRQTGDPSEISEYHRGLLRQLDTVEGRVYWVEYGPDGQGYVLTEVGVEALKRYFRDYGPSPVYRRGPRLGELIRLRQLVAKEAPEEADAARGKR
jgi:hypothetical protein